MLAPLKSARPYNQNNRYNQTKPGRNLSISSLIERCVALSLLRPLRMIPPAGWSAPSGLDRSTNGTRQIELRGNLITG
jgi:hypothetical protein